LAFLKYVNCMSAILHFLGLPRGAFFNFSLHFTSHVTAASHYVVNPPCSSLADSASKSPFFSYSSGYLLVSHIIRPFYFLHPPPAPDLEVFSSFQINFLDGACF
jgi:hypothetical protein